MPSMHTLLAAATALLAGATLAAAAELPATATLTVGGHTYDMYTTNFTETSLCGPDLKVELSNAGPSGDNYAFVYSQYTEHNQATSNATYGPTIFVPDGNGGGSYQAYPNAAAIEVGLAITPPGKTMMRNWKEWLWVTGHISYSYTCE